VIVVITDGGDTTSSTDFHGALKAAHMADAVIYSVLVMPITNDAGRNVGGENALTRSGATAAAFSSEPRSGIDRAFSIFSRSCARQYLLATIQRPSRSPRPVSSARREFRAICGYRARMGTMVKR